MINQRRNLSSTRLFANNPKGEKNRNMLAHANKIEITTMSLKIIVRASDERRHLLTVIPKTALKNKYFEYLFEKNKNISVDSQEFIENIMPIKKLAVEYHPKEVTITKGDLNGIISLSNKYKMHLGVVVSPTDLGIRGEHLGGSLTHAPCTKGILNIPLGNNIYFYPIKLVVFRPEMWVVIKGHVEMEEFASEIINGMLNKNRHSTSPKCIEYRIRTQTNDLVVTSQNQLNIETIKNNNDNDKIP